jgi:hypothetical protein
MDRTAKSTVRYEYRDSEAPLFLKPTWVRIETSDLNGITVERITPCEKPPEPTSAILNAQLAFQF